MKKEHDRLQAIEPDYSHFLDAKQLRRTSRIIRMGIAAALTCLRDAGLEMPDAIVTGTAYGCLEDTAVFLERLIHEKEQTLSPTAFIQSTHNTIGSQIALLLQCTNYNNTFVQRGLSFESALLDAMLLLEDQEARTVLVGGIDEITAASHAILRRFGLYRHLPAGEGAFFFLLSGEPSEKNLARLDGLHTFLKPASEKEVETHIGEFLEARNLRVQDIDLILSGATKAPSCLQAKHAAAFKPFCGEYPTASSFALGWAASEVNQNRTGKILIYTQYLATHSLLLVSHVEG